MKPTSIVLLLVALIAGGLAAFLATQQSGPVTVVEGPTTVVQEAKQRVLVATAPIGLGQRLSGETVQWLDWPEGAVRPDYITIAQRPEALEEITGAVARFEIFPGDPIIEAKLVRSGQGYLSAVLEKGKRGVSVAVDAASASGGFIVPNDHVDVVLTRQSPSGLISETIVRNVRVLAINLRLGETGTTGTPANPEAPNEAFQGDSIATLELDPQQGETVINAAEVGTISLSLRSMADVAVTEDPMRRNQSIRLIRAGNDSVVTAGQGDPAAQASAEPSNPEAAPVTVTQ